MICAVDNCGRKHKAHGWCHTHYMRQRRTGNVGTDSRACPSVLGLLPIGNAAATCRCRAPWRAAESRLTAWRVQEVTYIGAHYRVWARRGSAVDQACVHCGEQAVQWAYDHADPEALTDPKTGCAYSPNPASCFETKRASATTITTIFRSASHAICGTTGV